VKCEFFTKPAPLTEAIHGKYIDTLIEIYVWHFSDSLHFSFGCGYHYIDTTPEYRWLLAQGSKGGIYFELTNPSILQIPTLLIKSDLIVTGTFDVPFLIGNPNTGNTDTLNFVHGAFRLKAQQPDVLPSLRIYFTFDAKKKTNVVGTVDNENYVLNKAYNIWMTFNKDYNVWIKKHAHDHDQAMQAWLKKNPHDRPSDSQRAEIQAEQAIIEALNEQQRVKFIHSAKGNRQRLIDLKKLKTEVVSEKNSEDNYNDEFYDPDPQGTLTDFFPKISKAKSTLGSSGYNSSPTNDTDATADSLASLHVIKEFQDANYPVSVNFQNELKCSLTEGYCVSGDHLIHINPDQFLLNEKYSTFNHEAGHVVAAADLKFPELPHEDQKDFYPTEYSHTNADEQTAEIFVYNLRQEFMNQAQDIVKGK